MSSRINLNDNVNDTYEFSIGGLDYDFKYPTMTDIEPITNLYNEREAESKKGTPESEARVKEIDNQIEDLLYGLVIPVGHSTPIREILKTQSIRVVKNFNEMLNQQLSLE